MPLVFWDASALVLRYAPETGSDVVDAIFDAVPLSDMVLAMIGYSETFAILWRHRNRGTLTTEIFNEASSALEVDFVLGTPKLLEMGNASVLRSLGLIQRQNLNSTDAVILTLYLDYLAEIGRKDVVVVASDHRVLRAASAEGFAVIEPDGFDIKDVPDFLANL